MGGDGWFGTVGAGYDWQVNPSWVVGVFGDGQFGSLRGTVQDPFAAFTGRIKMQDAWAAGVRVGYLVAPNVLSYVNGGYTGSHWSGTTLISTFSGAAGGSPHQLLQPQWLVHRRRRREQPEHLRHHRRPAGS